MKSSVLICKDCGTIFTDKIVYGIVYPTDDEKLLEDLKKYAKEHIRCSRCGSRHWIRKVASKVF